MSKKEIIKYLKKELEDGTDYNFLALDLRGKKPSLFRAWWTKEIGRGIT